MIDRDKIREIAARTEGVTPGPWHNREGDIAPSSDDGNLGYWIAHLEDCGPNWKANAEHITRLDPAAVNELCRLALIGLETERAGDGWIEWKGGECPVEASVRVDVRFTEEHFDTDASGWDWRAGIGADITAYRLTPVPSLDQRAEG